MVNYLFRTTKPLYLNNKVVIIKGVMTDLIVQNVMEDLIVRAVLDDLTKDTKPIKLEIVPWADASFHTQHKLLRHRVSTKKGEILMGHTTVNNVQYWALESLKEYLWRMERNLFFPSDGNDDDEHAFLVCVPESLQQYELDTQMKEDIKERLEVEVSNLMGWEHNETMKYRVSLSIFQDDENREKLYVFF